MSYIVTEESYRGYKIIISYDEYAESPRDWDNLGTMYTAHRRFCAEKELDKHFGIQDVVTSIGWNHCEFKDLFLKKYVALPLFMYDHSGCTVKTTPFSCPWDSGWLGFIAVSVEDVKKEWKWKVLTAKRREEIENILRGEVETYDQYLRGDVYCYNIERDEDEDGWEDLPEIDDTLCGLYGEEYAIGEAKSVIDYCLAQNGMKPSEKEETIENYI